jgi:hypothetical protein
VSSHVVAELLLDPGQRWRRRLLRAGGIRDQECEDDSGENHRRGNASAQGVFESSECHMNESTTPVRFRLPYGNGIFTASRGGGTAIPA